VAAGRAWLAVAKLAALETSSSTTVSLPTSSEATASAEAAYTAAAQGIDELGTAYRHLKRELHDDSQNRILMASWSKQHGDVASAAQRLQAVLAWRIDAYVRHFEGLVA